MRNVLLKCLKQAGEIQLAKFQHIDKISIKQSISSIVTEVDFECEQAIIGIIQKEFPEHNILSEESGLMNNNSVYTWVIDPLDGTSNYAAGLPWFGILIGVFNGKEPILSGAYIPVSDKLYLAETGKGATLNGQALKIVLQRPDASLVSFSTDYTSDIDYLNRAVAIYKCMVKNTRNVRSTNSLVDLLAVAENRLGCCINMFGGVWDIAAPYLIIKESGGVFRGINNEEIDFQLDAEHVNANYAVILGSESIVDELMCKISGEH